MESKMSEFLAMCVFALVLSSSPGPVNLIILSIGMNHRAKAALPFIGGATVGFTLLLFLIGLGLEQLMRQAGYLLQILNNAGLAYIMYLGLKIAMSGGELKVKEASVPGFLQGFVLNWVNPKAWGACLAGIAAFKVAEDRDKLLVFVSLYFVICFFGISSWAVLGQGIHKFLTSERNMRIFNMVVGGALMLIAVALFFRT